VRHGPVLGHDRVLVAAERRQAVRDEPIERPVRLGGGDGEQPGAVHADRVEVHPVEVTPHLLVDVVLARLVRLGELQRLLLLRRRLSVVLVVVPAAADGFASVHENVEAAALVAVEVLHPEPGAVAGPMLEVLAGQGERRGGEDVCDEATFAQAVHEPLRGERGGFVDQDGPAKPFEGVGVGLGRDQRGTVAEVAGGVTQCRQHEVQLLPVVPAPPESGGGLDQQHLAVSMPAAVHRGAELVCEQPERCVVGHHFPLPGDAVDDAADGGWDWRS